MAYMGTGEDDFSSLKDALAGKISPEEKAASLRLAAGPMRRYFRLHLATAVLGVFMLGSFVGWLALGGNVLRIAAIAAGIATVVAMIGTYVSVRGLAPYSNNFDRVFANILRGRYIVLIFYYMCDGFRDIARENRDEELAARWNSRIFAPGIVLTVICVGFLILTALTVSKQALCLCTGVASVLCLITREFRYLSSVILTIKSLEK